MFSFFVNAQIASLATSACVVDGDVVTIRCAEVIFERLLTISSSLVLLVLFIMLIVGAFKYLTSGGEAEKLAGAQSTLKFAFIGTFLFLGSYLFLTVLQALFLGGKDNVEYNLFKFQIPEYGVSPMPTPTPRRRFERMTPIPTIDSRRPRPTPI
ncbi:MAG: hypothetical protein WBO77_00855 [Microgenomates group bacterium]